MSHSREARRQTKSQLPGMGTWKKGRDEVKVKTLADGSVLFQYASVTGEITNRNLSAKKWLERMDWLRDHGFVRQ